MIAPNPWMLPIRMRAGGRRRGENERMRERTGEGDSVLKAAGTPMIKALPLISLKRFTLLPGECSTRSTSGRALPDRHPGWAGGVE